MIYIPIQISNPVLFDRHFSVRLHSQSDKTFLIYARTKNEAIENVVLFCMEHNLTEDFFNEVQAKDFFTEYGLTFKKILGKYLLEDELQVEEVEDYRF